MQVTGRVSFSPLLNEDVSNYGIEFEPDFLKNSGFQNPTIWYYQLVAQERTYEFRVSCLSRKLEMPTPYTRTINDTMNDTSLTLLDRSALSVYGRPDCIDWQSLQNALRKSANDALYDPWNLRTDAKYWHTRFMEMKRNTSLFLHSVFGRIDIFLAASKTLEDGDWDEIAQARTGSYSMDQVKGMTSMYVTRQMILHQALASMEGHPRPQMKWDDATLCYLFDLMARNDPTLRVMGLTSAFRVVEGNFRFRLSAPRSNYHTALPKQSKICPSWLPVCRSHRNTHISAKS